MHCKFSKGLQGPTHSRAMNKFITTQTTFSSPYMSDKFVGEGAGLGKIKKFCWHFAILLLHHQQFIAVLSFNALFQTKPHNWKKVK